MLFKRFFYRAFKDCISRFKKQSGIFQFDKRKVKKITPIVSLLIEHLTEETNGHITAREIHKKLIKILNVNLHMSTIAHFRKKYLGRGFSFFTDRTNFCKKLNYSVNKVLITVALNVNQKSLQQVKKGKD